MHEILYLAIALALIGILIFLIRRRQISQVTSVVPQPWQYTLSQWLGSILLAAIPMLLIWTTDYEAATDIYVQKHGDNGFSALGAGIMEVSGLFVYYVLALIFVFIFHSLLRSEKRALRGKIISVSLIFIAYLIPYFIFRILLVL